MDNEKIQPTNTRSLRRTLSDEQQQVYSPQLQQLYGCCCCCCWFFVLFGIYSRYFYRVFWSDMRALYPVQNERGRARVQCLLLVFHQFGLFVCTSKNRCRNKNQTTETKILPENLLCDFFPSIFCLFLSIFFCFDIFFVEIHDESLMRMTHLDESTKGKKVG